jgi:hypothetical protein
MRGWGDNFYKRLLRKHNNIYLLTAVATNRFSFKKPSVSWPLIASSASAADYSVGLVN